MQRFPSDSVLLDPIVEHGHVRIDARKVFARAAKSPGHDAGEYGLAILDADERPSRVALATVESALQPTAAKHIARDGAAINGGAVAQCAVDNVHRELLDNV